MLKHIYILMLFIVSVATAQAESALDRLFDPALRSEKSAPQTRAYSSPGQTTGYYQQPSGYQPYGAPSAPQGSAYANPVQPGLNGAAWTIMVYMAADNNLDSAAMRDLQEMEQIGSSAMVNVVAFIDRERGWQTARQGLIIRHPEEDVQSLDPSLPTCQELGEVNSGDPETFGRFVSWAEKTFPAQHYALIVWNHGDGWRSLSGADGLGTRAICQDDTNGSKIYNRDLRLALERSGARLDVLAMDACLMGMVEVAWEMKDLAPVMVASSQNIPSDGFEYTSLLKSLNGLPSADAAGLGRMMVQSFASYYQNNPRPITLAAIDNSRLPALVGSMNELVRAIGSEENANPGRFSVQRVYGDAGREARRIDGNNSHVDLGLFLSEVSRRNDASPQTRASAEKALQAYNATMLDRFENSPTAGTGLAVYMPADSSAKFYGEYTAQNARFAQDSYWPYFIKAFAQDGKIELPDNGQIALSDSGSSPDGYQTDPGLGSETSNQGQPAYSEQGAYGGNGSGYDSVMSGTGPMGYGVGAYPGGPRPDDQFNVPPMGMAGRPTADITHIFLTEGRSGAQMVSAIEPGRIYWIRIRSVTAGARPGLDETVSVGLFSPGGRSLYTADRFKSYNFTNGDFIYTFRFKAPEALPSFLVRTRHIVSDRDGNIVAYDESGKEFQMGGNGFGQSQMERSRSLTDQPRTLGEARKNQMEAAEAMKAPAVHPAEQTKPTSTTVEDAPSETSVGAEGRKPPARQGASALDALFDMR